MPAVAAPRRFGAVNWAGLRTLVAREVWRALKEYRYSVLGPVVSNLLFFAVFQLALGDAAMRVGNVGYAEFLVPGLIIFAVCERAYETASESLIFDKLEGIIADLLMAPLTPLELTIGYAVSSAAAGLITGAAVAASLLPFVAVSFVDPGLLLVFALGGALMHGLLGTLVGLWAERWDHYAAALTFLVIPFAFLSGIFYSTAALPELGQWLVRLNPVFYVIDGFRAGCIGQAESATGFGALIVVAVIVGFAGWAYRLFCIGYKIKP